LRGASSDRKPARISPRRLSSGSHLLCAGKKTPRILLLLRLDGRPPSEVGHGCLTLSPQAGPNFFAVFYRPLLPLISFRPTQVGQLDISAGPKTPSPRLRGAEPRSGIKGRVLTQGGEACFFPQAVRPPRGTFSLARELSANLLSLERPVRYFPLFPGREGRKLLAQNSFPRPSIRISPSLNGRLTSPFRSSRLMIGCPPDDRAVRTINNPLLIRPIPWGYLICSWRPRAFLRPVWLSSRGASGNMATICSLTRDGPYSWIVSARFGTSNV